MACIISHLYTVTSIVTTSPFSHTVYQNFKKNTKLQSCNTFKSEPSPNCPNDAIPVAAFLYTHIATIVGQSANKN